MELEALKNKKRDLSTTKDVNVKQEARLDALVTDYKTLGQVLDKNKKLLPDWKKKNRKWMLAVVIVWNILGIMVLVTKANFATQIFNTILIISILVLSARRENYAEN